MFGLLLLIVICVAIILYHPKTADITSERTAKFADKLDRLWDIAQDSLREHKYLRAEKALLTILRVDERSATAYNRLGILYAKQHAYSDAIECFEIAQSLEPSASSLHNVGLIYLETDKLDKAALAFEQAISMEEDVPSRHIAYAKVMEKMGHTGRMIVSLERAVELERTPQAIRILADAYERTDNTDRAYTLREELKGMLKPKTTDASPMAAKKVKRPRRMV
jgi:tetratricopeptide (TPR) repeat protein